LSKPLGIIIPVYNEGLNIGDTINSIENKVRTPHHIYIGYDFDEDNTLPAIRPFIDDGLDITPIKNPVRGVISAIKTGLKEAEENYLLVTMADMSDDYTSVDKMHELMELGYDVVCGSRYMSGGKQIGGPLLKKTLSRLAGISLKYLTGLPTHDATNSFKLYRKTMLDIMKIESIGGFEIGIEIVTKAHFAGYKVTEIPTVWTDRTLGASRFKMYAWMPKYLKWYLYAIRNKFKLR